MILLLDYLLNTSDNMQKCDNFTISAVTTVLEYTFAISELLFFIVCTVCPLPPLSLRINKPAQERSRDYYPPLCQTRHGLQWPSTRKYTAQYSQCITFNIPQNTAAA